ncbi:MAG: lipopolysaccharide biosynthesis protein [Erysipelotrichaceae bacterium]|nr:lipopolysaccharide biosynthesis protein [Erysipelotrichaceae bacterium]
MIQKIRNVIIGNENSSMGKNVIWNMLGSLIYALSTIVLTIVTTRIVGENYGGDFAIALGTGQIMAAIGYYEVRTIQVTDLHQKYQFHDYVIHRMFTIALMMLVSIGFVMMKAYAFEKCLLILVLCLWKMLDTVADVFEGLFQQQERLDLSGKSMFARTLFSTLAYIICLTLTKQMLLSAFFAIAVSIFCIWIFDFLLTPVFACQKWIFSKEKIIKLFKESFPLFAGTFMFSYISNSARYAIDAQMNASDVAYFTAIFLPVSTINLVSGFIFKPLLTTFAAKWESDSPKQFAHLMGKFVSIIVCITFLIALGGYILGVEILSFLYGLKLDAYRFDLILLLIGGGFSAFSTIEYYCLAVMRVQKFVFIGYLFVFVLSLIFPNLFVIEMGLRGAAFCYLMLMLLIVAAFSIGIYLGFRRKEAVL